ncbi:MAG: hypothetical protein KJ970_19950 [Candidatus Eisenbacteria bacterium]|uniref:Uncharacterized protein n=1 Tax=Eiseniibacteriota bacterium TaxID=2212470 RepID=A0A948S085_UNCEI|nr:hypothetical protein [Candidatus Eisenbacteria bacterium]MBU1950336.1 hypothetical protein [Candidatus Eisenbacteria bacterium]MBU2693196.1 hypothetical protein [Candidatus Eisenbacteria bacterium]
MLARILIWVLAFFITAASAVYQRVTGPTTPLRGETTVGNTDIKFKLLRTEVVGKDALVAIDVSDPSITGLVKYKRLRSHDDWITLQMIRREGRLTTTLPRQPSAGKMIYFVYLEKGDEPISLSGETPVTIRYKGAVPGVVLWPHVFLIFLAMLFANRTTIEAIRPKGNPSSTLGLTLGLLLIGGMIMGPIMQKYAFGAFWTGFPRGHDLTDNKMLIAVIVWIWAWFRNRGGQRNRAWIIFAGLVVFAIFMIPHSMLGSELDYTNLPEGAGTP